MDNLYENISPLIIRYAPQDTRVAIVRTQNNTQKALAGLEKVTKSLNPEYPLRYQFMDVEYANSYQREKSLKSLCNFFAGVAIFISCLGLLGLSSFSADQRTKEIGIRKVLGANVRQIVMMLSKEYTVLMLLAFVIAAPVSYFLMNNWLANFAFRTNLNAIPFVISGLVAIVVGALTVILKSWQAAGVNPVSTLKEQ
jgi:ABC-type antimicrobial peptide transport system permease subunit